MITAINQIDCGDKCDDDDGDGKSDYGENNMKEPSL
jgi:hypothetical protein